MSPTFTDLLSRIGAVPPRSGRGKWWCGRCRDARTPALSVDLNRELYCCHRCGWSGGRRTLERELHIVVPKSSQADLKRTRVIREEAARFAEHVRSRRIETAALVRDLGGYEIRWREVGREQLESGQLVSEVVFGKLEKIAALQERAEGRYHQLCELEGNGTVLYQEYLRESREAA